MEISIEEKDLPKENKPTEEEEELITDFSQMFKGKGFAKRPPKLAARQVEPTPNWLLQIPAKLDITKQELCERKQFDQRRWHSIVKCQQESDRIIATVASAWNYLYSSKGTGSLAPLTVKKAKGLLQAKNVKYQTEDEFERASLILACFEALCTEFQVKSEANVVIKPAIPNKIEATQAQILNILLKGLKKEDSSYAFLTYKNILCPIGFDKTPLVPLDAYRRIEEIKPENQQLWIVNGSTQRFQPSFVSKRWRDVKLNLETVWPNVTNLNEAKKGPIPHPDANEANQAEERGNSFCIIEFRKCSES